ncbi:hypothetical protein SAMN05444000_11521 [Shimia gijangensis]|uniref:Uncharacterized protein n=1 Tax=Shimia gijangensis TaxID=1470563 RepID=A0A1M6N2R5_9RHOB|nr:hypothetical protein [Shimia gijangensis]SHJ89987.1 hypothetical protein SAMN05444000_11521 [Shimia gijangensis]
MNSNQLINMVLRIFVRKAMRFGMKAGTKALSSEESAGRATPQDQRSGKMTQPDAQHTRQAMRITKKMTRF